jgi:hypothetical protein
VAVDSGFHEAHRQGAAAAIAENKKALVSEGFSDKQVLDLVGCAGKI